MLISEKYPGLACLVLLLVLCALPLDSYAIALSLGVGSAAGPARSIFKVPVTVAPNGNIASVVVLRISYDPTALDVLDVLPGDGIAAAKSRAFHVNPGQLTAIVYDGPALSVPATLLQVVVALSSTATDGTAYALTASGSSASTPNAADIPLTQSNGSINANESGGYHTADYSRDRAISLSELLRLIQFYNSAGLHCATASEDGYGVGTGDESCAPHSLDYAPQDWRISLPELLRAIQFYNSPARAYHVDERTEDGFAPGPSPIT